MNIWFPRFTRALPGAPELDLTREEAQQLELREGQILSVRLPAPRVFSA